MVRVPRLEHCEASRVGGADWVNIGVTGLLSVKSPLSDTSAEKQQEAESKRMLDAADESTMRLDGQQEEDDDDEASEASFDEFDDDWFEESYESREEKMQTDEIHRKMNKHDKEENERIARELAEKVAKGIAVGEGEAVKIAKEEEEEGAKGIAVAKEEAVKIAKEEEEKVAKLREKLERELKERKAARIAKEKEEARRIKRVNEDLTNAQRNLLLEKEEQQRVLKALAAEFGDEDKEARAFNAKIKKEVLDDNYLKRKQADADFDIAKAAKEAFYAEKAEGSTKK